MAVPPFSTAAAPFTVDGVHPVDQTFPNPSLDAPAITSLYAAGEWGNAPWMEAPVRYMAPDAAASASPGFSGNAFTLHQPQLLVLSELVIDRCGNSLGVASFVGLLFILA